MPPKEKMRYDDLCLKFGFTVIKSAREEKPSVFYAAQCWHLLH